jgi:endonuclease YncB( thermonuclease family)
VTVRRPAEFDTWPAELAAPFGPYRAVICHHVDGDTFDCLVDVGWNDYKYRPVRLLGVDTPETNRAATKAAGLAAKAYVQQLIPVGAPVLLHTIPDPDSFGRYLARIQLRDGRDLTDLILVAGHGVPA